MSGDGWWRFAQDATVPDGTGSVSRDEQDAVDDLRRAFDPEPVPTTDAFDAVVVVEPDPEEAAWTAIHRTSGTEYTVHTARRLDDALRWARTVGVPVKLVGHEQLFTDPTPEQVRDVEERLRRER